MKRIGIALGVLLWVSGTTAWAQSNTDWPPAQQAAIARQEADNARREADRALQLAALQANPARPAAPAPAALPAIGNITVGQPFQVLRNQAYNLSTAGSDNPLGSLQVASGTWWNNPDKAKLLNLTKDQQKKMDDIFQQYRLKLIDLNASLSKEEAIMDPLIASEKLDEAKILVQIDRIAQARAELEKANSRLLLGIRQSLTMDQWTQVQSPANRQLLRR